MSSAVSHASRWGAIWREQQGLTYEDGRWVPYFALCLFAGICPGVPNGEITKLQPDTVDLDAGIISISAEVSKVREPRKVTIQPNLAAWLRA